MPRAACKIRDVSHTSNTTGAPINHGESHPMRPRHQFSCAVESGVVLASDNIGLVQEEVPGASTMTAGRRHARDEF